MKRDTNKECSIPDCHKPAVKRGWCNMHYIRVYMHGSPDIGRRERAECIVEGCHSKVQGHGYCPKHYTRLRRYGSIDRVNPHPTKHGFARSSIYLAWQSIKFRCLNPNSRSYYQYGGRGIKICQRWRDSFQAFYDDVGPKPSPDYSIDRVNTNLHYSCGKCEECIANGWIANCRWATRTQQSLNTRLRKTNKSGYRGVSRNSLNSLNWLARISFEKKTIHIGSFRTKEEAARAYNEAALKYHGEDAKLNDLPL